MPLIDIPAGNEVFVQHAWLAAQIRYTIIVVISSQQAIQMKVHPTHTRCPQIRFFFSLLSRESLESRLV